MTPIGEPFEPQAGPHHGRECPGPDDGGPGDARPGPPGLPSGHCTPSRSTTKMRVSFGLITPPAPRLP
jgi:hypothetical protein